MLDRKQTTENDHTAPKPQKMSDRELATKAFFHEPHQSIAYCFGLPTFKALDNAMLTLLWPMLVFGDGKCGVGLSVACLPCDLVLAAPVVGVGTLGYNSCLFAKGKTEQCMEKNPEPDNELKPSYR